MLLWGLLFDPQRTTGQSNTGVQLREATKTHFHEFAVSAYQPNWMKTVQEIHLLEHRNSELLKP